MANEKHDPWELLREALGWMREVADRRGRCPDCEECDRRDAIIVKADAALAERQDSAKDVVESDAPYWVQVTPSGHRATFRGALLDTWKRYDNGHWVWEVRGPTQGYRSGDVFSEAEAKSAAIAAARGKK